MKRFILAFVLGLLGWVVVASLLNRGLRLALDGYTNAEPHMTFTLGMMAARLALGAIASLAAGAIAGRLAPSDVRVAWSLGVALLIAFIPVHVSLWDAFPAWYHLTFLVSLLPCVVLGARFTRTGNTRVPEPAEPT